MPSFFKRLIWSLLLAAGLQSAAAHSGHGSNAQVRIFSDKMRVVIRTSIPLAWAQLGDQAPMMADEAGRETARPLLIAAAPSMMDVTAGGKPVLPIEADCVFEVDDHVAFVLTFARPSQWPVELDARYIGTLGDLDTGTITVFDQTESRFVTDLEPIVHKMVSNGDSNLSFSLPALPLPAVISEPVPAPPAPNAVAEKQRGLRFGIPTLLIFCALMGIVLIWRNQRGKTA